MPVDALMTMTWSENGDRPNDEEYCACCDKKVRADRRRIVEVTADMSQAVAPGLGLDPNDSGGCFCVGPDCAKKYLPGFTTAAA